MTAQAVLAQHRAANTEAERLSQTYESDMKELHQ